jgi:branched-chain amino acid transport system ATP-binding protein/urea transport system ATP-binding protein
VLNGAVLSVEKGEILGILGHNGMGKTTLLRTLIGQLPAKAGQVLLRGRDLTRLPPHRRAREGLGYVPQGRGIFPHLSVRDNLRMGYTGAQRDEAARLEQVLSAFPRLVRLLDRQGGSLSGGEQQLLSLARCLCGSPALILLDEPTEGIQPSVIEEIGETLKLLKSVHGLTVIVVEQNLEFLASISDRMLRMHKGSVSPVTDIDRIKEEAFAEPASH